MILSENLLKFKHEIKLFIAYIFIRKRPKQFKNVFLHVELPVMACTVYIL